MQIEEGEKGKRKKGKKEKRKKHRRKLVIKEREAEKQKERSDMLVACSSNGHDAPCTETTSDTS